MQLASLPATDFHLTLAGMNIGDYVFPIGMGLLASLSLISIALRIGREIDRHSADIDIAVYVGLITAVVAAIATSSDQLL